MASVFEKLELKALRKILMVNAPLEFEPHDDRAGRYRHCAPFRRGGEDLAFAVVQADVDRLSRRLVTSLEGDDPVLWFAYPKAAFKRYQCDFNRDTVWDVLRALGFDTVRQVAIDAD